MRVSGRKLRYAVGAGIAALMLVLGVTSVGASAPGTVGNINIVVTSAGTSALSSPNTTVTAANYRDAPVIVNVLSGAGGLGRGYDDCDFLTTGNPNVVSTVTQPKGTISVTDVSPFICGNTNPIIQPPSYPLWEVQTGTAINGRGSSNILVVPPTTNRPPGTPTGHAYAIETFS